MKKSILVIDDEENMRHMLKAMLVRGGYEVELAENGWLGLQAVKEALFDFILCDVRMPEMDGMAFLEKSASYIQESTVIMMSAYGTVDMALQAMKLGAYDYISKPFKADEVILTLKKAEEREILKRENLRLRDELRKVHVGESFGAMIGESEAMQKVFSLARRVSGYSTTVLITGESGTGKELLARGLHDQSGRGSEGFHALNCGSIPENLLESELFGFVKGAFTGADQDKKGLFSLADKGTLFLDEIGDLPLPMQVKMLRVLQEGEVRPLGGSRPEKIDVRIIAATSKDLNTSVKKGEFREDLLYRLNVMHLHLPPLRSRLGDIPLLVAHFLEKMSLRHGLSKLEISQEALSALVHHAWPGNVRELENVIERTLIMVEGPSISRKDLPDNIGGSSTPNYTHIGEDTLSLKSAQMAMEATLIKKALEKTEWNKSRAAELLELSYPSLLAKIKKYKLS